MLNQIIQTKTHKYHNIKSIHQLSAHLNSGCLFWSISVPVMAFVNYQGRKYYLENMHKNWSHVVSWLNILAEKIWKWYFCFVPNCSYHLVKCWIYSRNRKKKKDDDDGGQSKENKSFSTSTKEKTCTEGNESQFTFSKYQGWINGFGQSSQVRTSTLSGV